MGRCGATQIPGGATRLIRRDPCDETLSSSAMFGPRCWSQCWSIDCSDRRRRDRIGIAAAIRSPILSGRHHRRRRARPGVRQVRWRSCSSCSRGSGGADQYGPGARPVTRFTTRRMPVRSPGRYGVIPGLDQAFPASGARTDAVTGTSDSLGQCQPPGPSDASSTSGYGRPPRWGGVLAGFRNLVVIGSSRAVRGLFGLSTIP